MFVLTQTTEHCYFFLKSTSIYKQNSIIAKISTQFAHNFKPIPQHLNRITHTDKMIILRFNTTVTTKTPGVGRMYVLSRRAKNCTLSVSETQMVVEK